MSGMSRRDLLRASAGAAAVAVPISALSAGGIAAADGVASRLADEAALTEAGAGPVIFSVTNPAKGEVSVLQGTNEVIVRDRQLVAKIMRAANSRRAL
jgi:hypothetical protein